MFTLFLNNSVTVDVQYSVHYTVLIQKYKSPKILLLFFFSVRQGKSHLKCCLVTRKIGLHWRIFACLCVGGRARVQSPCSQSKTCRFRTENKVYNLKAIKLKEYTYILKIDLTQSRPFFAQNKHVVD